MLYFCLQFYAQGRMLEFYHMPVTNWLKFLSKCCFVEQYFKIHSSAVTDKSVVMYKGQNFVNFWGVSL